MENANMVPDMDLAYEETIEKIAALDYIRRELQDKGTK